MKIRQFQVTIKPCRYPSLEGDWRDLSVEVIADGRTMTTSHTIRTSDFEDEFGAMMRESERLIRRAVKEAEAVVETVQIREVSTVKNSP